MFKRFLLMAAVLLIAAAPNAFAAVGIFDFSEDIGNVGGTGGTRYVATDEYLVLGGGSDIWGNADQFHFAYNEVSGNVRFEMSPAWDIGGANYWGKIESMLRVNTSAGSVHWSTATRRGDDHNPNTAEVDDWAGFQIRSEQDAGSWGGVEWSGQVPSKLATQRVVSNGYQIVQSLVDYGSGWQAMDTRLVPSLPDALLAGVAVTSHDNNWLVQAKISDAAYTQDPDLVGIPTAGDPLAEACGDTPGFKVSAAKMPAGWGFWDDTDGSNGDARSDKFKQAEYLVKNGTMAGYVDFFGEVLPPADAIETGSKIVDLVNFADDGANRDFHVDNGFPDVSFPGIDSWIDPADDTDGDDQFGVVVEACVELTEGLHAFGGAFDDGVLIRVGGVEIGRTYDWNETSLWFFDAPVAGVYSLEAIGYEEGGGAFLELYEYLQDGTRILMGDVANGASPVYVPEPATIALLGFGGLSMLRIRKKR